MSDRMEAEHDDAYDEAMDSDEFADEVPGSDKKSKKTERAEERRRVKKNLQEKSVALNKDKAVDTARRYTYLLGQTELFRHFIKKSKVDIDIDLVMQEEDAKSKAKSASERRRRRTEKEEDEEILKQEVASGVTDHFTESPTYVKNGKMRDYQLQGLNWLISLYENGINGILADEMGLGKTLQTISFLGYLKHFRDTPGPHIVVVPKSTLHNWVSEFNRWVPDFKVLMFHGNKDDRAVLVKERLVPQDFEVVVTSYEMCLLEKSQFRKISWQYIVIDEAHRIKNENSMLSQIVRTFDCRNRLLITGTPLQNNLHELWALLNFLLPDVFSSAEDFDTWFLQQGGDQEKVVYQLHKVLSPFLLRRIKADVEKSLLPKKRINLYVGMSTMQRNWYRKILEKDIEAVNGVAGGREGRTRLQNIVMQLRKCCNHPYLFDGAEPGPPYTTDQHLVDNAGKMALLDKLLPRLKANGSRVLLFSQMSRVLDILEDYCLWKQHGYCRIDGQTAHEDRVSQIDEFNREGSDKFMFLLTTRAGGLGINLATADIVIMYDSDWNPQVDLQAEDRAHRIGQKKQVVVFRFITEDAIEEKVIEKATQKLRLDQLVIQQGKASSQSKAATKDELLNMIQHGAENIFSSTGENPINEINIEDILKKGEEKTQELEAKYQQMGIDDLQNMTMEGATYEWEGEDFSKNRARPKFGGIAWIAPAKRERKMNYDVNQYYRDAMRGGGEKKEPMPRGPRGPRPMFNFQDFHFAPKRLEDLLHKELLHTKKIASYQLPRPDSDNPEAERDWEEQMAAIESAEPLTELEIAEKAELDSQTYESWTPKDFKSFVRACEKHGRNNLDAITREVDGKTAEEVRIYSEVFWSRYQEMSDWEKVIGKIEDGEEKLRRNQSVQKHLSQKVAEYRLPMQQLKIMYNQNSKAKNFTDEEDRFLLVTLEHLGYGTDDLYEKMRQEVKHAPMFRFDWFLKSRNALELGKRCEQLLKLLAKEGDIFDEKKRKRDEKREGTPTSAVDVLPASAKKVKSK